LSKRWEAYHRKIQNEDFKNQIKAMTTQMTESNKRLSQIKANLTKWKAIKKTSTNPVEIG